MSDAEDRLRLMGLSVGAELATLMVELFGGGGGANANSMGAGH